MASTKNEQKNVLEAARDLIARPYGWTQRDYRRKSSRTADGYAYCALGALRRAHSTRATDLDIQDLAELLRKELKGTKWSDHRVHHWNDAVSDKRAVLRVFDKAITRLSA